MRALAFAALALLAGCGDDTSTSTMTTESTTSTFSTQTFSGNGGRDLGTVTVKFPSELHWGSTGRLVVPAFGIRSKDGEGRGGLAPGVYEDVVVRAQGAWTISVEGGTPP